MPVITVEPGTTTAAKWGESITITPVGPDPLIPGQGFSPTPGTVELLAVGAVTGLEVLSWTSGSVTAKLPQAAPAGGPYEIRLQDAIGVPRVAPLNVDGGLVIGPIIGTVAVAHIVVPTLLVLFRLPGFDDYDDPYNGACTVVPLPGNPTDALVDHDDNPTGLSQKLNEVLTPIGEALNPGTSEPGHWANFFTGYERLTKQVPLQKSIRVFLPAIANLKDIRYFTQKFAGLIDDWKADIYAEDTTSSLILIGPRGTKATLFNYRQFNDEGGVLEIEITDESGVGAAVIPDLHRGDPASETGGCRITGRGASQWGDMLGSLTLEAPSAAFDPNSRSVVPLPG